MRAPSSRVRILLAPLAVLVASCGGGEKPLILVESGQSGYRIVMPARATESEVRAAGWLRAAIAEISGVALPIVGDDAPAVEQEIIVGRGRRLTEEPVEEAVRLDGLGEDGFLVKTVGARIVIAGGGDAGTLRGAASFLEDPLGCRKLSKDATLRPKSPRIAIRALDRREVPAFAYREILMPDAFDDDYADWHGIDNRRARDRDWGMWVHTFRTLVPPERYFRRHPEYFTEQNGIRIPDAQLCLTNADVFRIVVAGLRERMKAKPEARYWSVSQNDTYSPCRCPACRAMDEKYGGPSGTILAFVNRVAREFPDKVISTLAYQYFDREYATMKLVLMLTTGAVFALVGLLALYVQAEPRTFDMVALERLAQAGHWSRATQLVWFPVVFLGFAVLVPMWPLHSWSPGGHAAAPAAVSMLHAGVLMKLGAYGILRIALTYMPEAANVYLPWVAALCCMNILYGGFVAMAQRDMKFVVGYSSSSHMGYVLLGIAAANTIGIEGAVFLMFAHGVMTALAFSLIGFFYDQTHTRMLDDLGGLMKRMPFVGTAFVIMTMASAGVPGFANFASELLVIAGAWKAGLVIPAVLAVWGIVVTGVYLLRTVKDAFLGPMSPRWEGLRDATRPVEKLPYVLLIATLLLFGFWPQPLLDVIEQGTTPIAEALQGAARVAAAR